MTLLMVGEKVSKYKMEHLMDEMKYLSSKGIVPNVELIRLGGKEDSCKYQNSIKKKFDRLGIHYHETILPEDISAKEFTDLMMEKNGDRDIHGILLFRPIPSHLPESNLISPEKDIEGTAPFNIGKILYGDMSGLLACTPLAVMELLTYYQIELTGTNVVIVGHSAIVGKPLSIMLLNQGATVTTAHIHTRNLEEITRKADVIISATGKRGLITKEHVKLGAVVIDVGISVDQYGKVHGDVLFEEVMEVASYITPVPGGVGAVTTTMLASQVLKAARLALAKEKQVSRVLGLVK